MMAIERSGSGYLLSGDEIAILLREQLALWPAIASDRQFSIRLLDLGADQRLAQVIEAKVFRRDSGARAQELIDAWYLYEQGNFAIMLIANANQATGEPAKIVGSMRIGCGALPRDFRTIVHLTEPEPWGFDSIQTLEQTMVGYSWDRVWDISALVVDAEVKQIAAGRKAVIAIFHALFQLMEARDTQLLMGIVAERVYHELNTLGLGLVPLGALETYYAQRARPFVIHVGMLPENLGKKEHYRRMLLDGMELDEFDIQV